MCRLVNTRSRRVRVCVRVRARARARAAAAALPRCIVVWALKEAAAPEFEEFEVSKSGLHLPLRFPVCTVVAADRQPGNASLQTRPIRRHSRPRVVLIAAARTRTWAI